MLRVRVGQARLALAGVVLTLTGCEWARPGPRWDSVDRLPGISVVEYDGLNLHLERDPSSGVWLIVYGQAAAEADLRVNDQFGLTDGAQISQAYQVLQLDERRIVLKRRENIDRRAERRGTQRVETVIAVAPYDTRHAADTARAKP
ncbi:MAG: hypothetical protein HRF50_15260 [Phycisphaerae bacterium]